jgi:hypothetical protein
LRKVTYEGIFTYRILLVVARPEKAGVKRCIVDM